MASRPEKRRRVYSHSHKVSAGAELEVAGHSLLRSRHKAGVCAWTASGRAGGARPVSVGTAVCSLRRPVHEGCSWNDGNDDNDDDSGCGWQQEEGDDHPDSAEALS